MAVQVIDVKTGKLKSMPERYARILVKAKRARWPEPAAVVVEEAAPAAAPEAETEAPSEDAAPKKRGRKPKAQE